MANGVINSVAQNGNILYLGGSFNLVGVRTGSGVPVSPTTGQPEAVYPSVNSDVDAVIQDGQGGWYIGGAFSLVGGLPRSQLAHIRSDRTVDLNFAPAVAGSGVNALLLSGTTLYFGGGFTNVNGQIRNSLAAVDAVSGALNPWDPELTGTVQSLAIDGTNIYIGGQFSAIGGQLRNGLGAADTIAGQVTAWNPGVTSPSGSPPIVYTLLSAGGHLFLGGYFATVGGQTRSCAASFTLATGALDAWNPNVVGLGIVAPTIFAMASYSNTVFAVGVMSSAGTSNRINMVQLDANTGLATSWDAKQTVVFSSGFPESQISSLGIYSNTVYVGGRLMNIGGQPRSYAAALDANTAQATVWNPQPNFIPLAFCGMSNVVYVGGVFGALNCLTRTNLAAYDLAAHQFTPLSTTITSPTNATTAINSLLVASNKLFIGGYFTNVNGVTISNLAALDPATGAVQNWTPNPNNSVFSLANWSNRLEVGGFFTSIGGIVRTNFAEFVLDDGSMSFWDPLFSRTPIYSLAVDGNTLYAGGLFTAVGGQTRSHLAAFDLTTDTLTSFDTGISGSYVRSVVAQNGRVHVGGRFNSVLGLSYSNYFSISADMSQLFPPHNLSGTVYGMAVASNTVYLGGFIDTVDGQLRTNLASIDLLHETLTSWSPNPEYNVLSLTVAGNMLYAAGQFLHAGGETTLGIAAFPLGLMNNPEIVPGSMRRLSDGSAQFHLLAQGALEATVLTSSNLLNWLPVTSVPLIDGNGVFTDADATNHPRRFYRLSVP